MTDAKAVPYNEREIAHMRGPFPGLFETPGEVTFDVGDVRRWLATIDHERQEHWSSESWLLRQMEKSTDRQTRYIAENYPTGRAKHGVADVGALRLLLQRALTAHDSTEYTTDDDYAEMDDALGEIRKHLDGTSV